MQEELLGYVLGALDATEERNIRQKIESDPSLREEVQRLQASILPLDHLDNSLRPQPGLARRTCEWVATATKIPDTMEAHYVPDHLAELASSAKLNTPLSPAELPAEEISSAEIAAHVGSVSGQSLLHDDNADNRVMLSEGRFQLLHPHTWSFSDALAGIAIIAVMGSMLFPALSYQRYNSRKMACQDNLRRVGQALLKYSDINGGKFVAIPSAGRLSASGYFAPVLKDAGLVEDDSVFNCAGLAVDTPVHIPSIAQLESANDCQLEHLKRNMSGHFGYSMGYSDGKKYQPLSNSGLTNTVLVADMPSVNKPGRRSINHGSWGQNCLFGDGHVEFIKGDSVGEDAIFVNDYGIVAPGISPRDSVIAPSHLSPASRQ